MAGSRAQRHPSRVVDPRGQGVQQRRLHAACHPGSSPLSAAIRTNVPAGACSLRQRQRTRSCLQPPCHLNPPACSTLMCRATNADAALLSDRELAALVAIDWEVQAVLKKGGLVL